MTGGQDPAGPANGEVRGTTAADENSLNELATQFQELARTMVSTEPGQQLGTKRLLQFAAASVPGGEHAAITLVGKHSRPNTVAASDEVPRNVDALQYETGEGPCLDALLDNDIAHAADLATDPQWPAFGPRAASETGVRSMLSFRLFLTEGQHGALNFYAGTPGAFDTLALSTGAIFASYTSLLLLNEIHQDESLHLRRALDSNREIGMALGILMARGLHTPEEAFRRLRVASQHLHRKLHDIAEEVIHTGELPDHPTGLPQSPDRKR